HFLHAGDVPHDIGDGVRFTVADQPHQVDIVVRGTDLDTPRIEPRKAGDVEQRSLDTRGECGVAGAIGQGRNRHHVDFVVDAAHAFETGDVCFRALFQFLRGRFADQQQHAIVDGGADVHLV